MVAELTFNHVVELTTYHVGIRKHLTEFAEIKDKYVSAPYPAWTAIGVSELIAEGTIVEIKAVARRSSLTTDAHRFSESVS